MIKRTRVYFTFKEVETDFDDNEEYLITVHSNPYEYEVPLDLIWDTEAEAREWVTTEAADWDIDKEESDAWVLVKVTEDVV